MISAFAVLALFLRALIPADLMLQEDAATGEISFVICSGRVAHGASALSPAEVQRQYILQEKAERAMQLALGDSYDGGQDQDTPQHHDFDVCPFAASLILAAFTSPPAVAQPLALADGPVFATARQQLIRAAQTGALPARGPPASA